VPWYALGGLDLRASRDLAGLGPTEGEAVHISCPWHVTLGGALLWAAPPLLLVRKSNRRRRAWVLLALLVAIVLALLCAEKALGDSIIFWSDRETGCGACQLLRTVALAMTICLLLADWFSQRRRLVRFLGVAAILIGVGVADLALNPWLDTQFLSPHPGIRALVWLTGLAVLIFVLHKLFGPRRLGLTLIICCFICAAATVAPWAIFAANLQFNRLIHPDTYRPLIWGATFFCGPYLILLPYLIAAKWNHYVHERLYDSLPGSRLDKQGKHVGKQIPPACCNE
jgi:hypothetical protein